MDPGGKSHGGYDMTSARGTAPPRRNEAVASPVRIPATRGSHMLTLSGRARPRGGGRSCR
eukprot:14139577-Alexandrium_andersonii.AAC.1